ncbi:MAG: SDR family NAD(P)-dependent oxidoreductase [Archangium sp.]|nr:SDR family NAD(P)-dependent oxidoreductase [Archangium sp.]
MILLTGGGRGLGRFTAQKLAEAGHEVLLTARDAAAGERAVDEIRAGSPRARVRALTLDLGSLASLRALTDSLLAAGQSLDVLFHVAGVMQQSPVRRVTVDGLEETLAVNALAPLYLTHRLEPLLSGRAVFVSSRLHLPGSRGVPVHFDFDDPQLEHGYHPQRAYKNSKLAVLWVASAFTRRWAASARTAHAVCPGFVPETVAASTQGFQRFLMTHVLAHMPFARSPAEAVDSFVFMATDAGVARQPGLFWGEKQPLASSPESRDEAKSERFFAWGLRTLGLPG